LQHSRLRRFRVAGAVHRAVVDVGNAVLVHRDTDRAGVDLQGAGHIGTAGGDVRLARQAEAGPKATKSVALGLFRGKQMQTTGHEAVRR
jgi:hypothetical protein